MAPQPEMSDVDVALARLASAVDTVKAKQDAHEGSCVNWRRMLFGTAGTVLAAGLYIAGLMNGTLTAVKDLNAAISTDRLNDSREMVSMREEVVRRIELVANSQIQRATATQTDVDRLNALLQRQMTSIEASLEKLSEAVHKIEVAQAQSAKGSQR